MELRQQVASVAESAGFAARFVPTGRQALKALTHDDSISAIILDKYFKEANGAGTTASQALQGRDILLRIRTNYPTIPIVILTQDDSYIQAQRFLEAGANRYIVKEAFEQRPAELKSFLSSLKDDPDNQALTLHLIVEDDAQCEMYITDQACDPILKRSRKLRTPLAEIVLGCARNRPMCCVEFPEQDSHGVVRGLEPFNRVDIQKAVYSLNRGLVASSEGRMQPLLHGGLRFPGSNEIQSVYGRSAFTLMVGRVEIHDTGERNASTRE